MARALSNKAVFEHLMMEGQSIAMEGAGNENLKRDVREMFARIAETVWYAQAVHRGIPATDPRFNEHLKQLLGDEQLN